jgi:hypothetical protein
LLVVVVDVAVVVVTADVVRASDGKSAFEDSQGQ